LPDHIEEKRVFKWYIVQELIDELKAEDG